MLNITLGLAGIRAKTERTLETREVLVGRSRRCDLVLPDEGVSGVHCRLVAIEGGTIVLDEGSTNGTWLNGAAVVRPTLVELDDELCIGRYVLKVRSLIGKGTGAVVRRPGTRPPVETERTCSHLPKAQVFFSVLGLKDGASMDEVQARYEALMAQYHPDKVAQMGPEQRVAAEQKRREVHFAWEYIQRVRG